MEGEHERRTSDEVADEQQAEAVEDLDVPEGQDEDVTGGMQGWPKKYEG